MINSGLRSRIFFPILFVLCLLIAGLVPGIRLDGAPADTQLNFEIRLPDNLSSSAKLFITGNHHALGDWDPGLIEVPRVGNRARWSVSLPPDYVLQFKFTLGDWGHVEAAVDGSEIENRVLPVPRGHTTLRVAVSGFKSPGSPEQWPSTIVGNVHVHRDFPGRNLAARTLWVYLPPGYDQEAARRYPVIYMQDGNNCFDAATSFNGQEWKVDETFEEGIASGALPAVIVVGIANTAARVDEYTMVKALRGDRRTRIGGKADLYASFLIDEVKPFIDSTYRTLVDASHTAVIGSSHGGLVSLYLGIRHPGVFGAVGAVSPTLSWGNRWLTNYVRHLHALPESLRIWLDMGTAEDAVDRNGNGISDLIDDVQEMRDLLLARGYDPSRVELMLDEGAVHNEAAWARRLPQILEFICRPWQ
ncbi:MAG: alpha/beta hydrolase-fold protein [Candidatus Rifleibacteriota bacterium]